MQYEYCSLYSNIECVSILFSQFDVSVVVIIMTCKSSKLTCNHQPLVILVLDNINPSPIKSLNSHSAFPSSYSSKNSIRQSSRKSMKLSI